jgi:signal transduction histidine kinase
MRVLLVEDDVMIAQGLETALRQIGAAVERSIHLVEQLLTLARSDPGETSPSLERVDLAVVAAAAIADSRVLAMTRNIDIGLDAEPSSVVQGESAALRTLARNLIDVATRIALQRRPALHSAERSPHR